MEIPTQFSRNLSIVAILTLTTYVAAASNGPALTALSQIAKKPAVQSAEAPSEAAPVAKVINASASATASITSSAMSAAQTPARKEYSSEGVEHVDNLIEMMSGTGAAESTTEIKTASATETETGTGTGTGTGTESDIDIDIDIDVEPVKLLTAFNTDNITSFLAPYGFIREDWQAVANHPQLKRSEGQEKPFVVMLDPGHGGSDPGAQAHNGLMEKDLTLDIAQRARAFLSEIDNFKVILTRNHDHGLSRQSRVDAIKRSKADAVVSLHFNHLPQTELTLVETFYAGPENIAISQAHQREQKRFSAMIKTANHAALDLTFTRGSARLAETLQQRIYNEVSLDNPTADNAGVKQETLFVLTRSFTPGVLIEMTPLSNEDEANKLSSEEYRNRLAAALVDGIRSYRSSLIESPLDEAGDIGA